MLKLEVILLFILAIRCGRTSYLKNPDLIEIESEFPTDFPSTETTTETVTEVSQMENDVTESFFNSPLVQLSENESTADETELVEIPSGTYFRLMMTVFQVWTDDFMDKSSEKFQQLDTGLGSELIDLVDNSRESLEPNLTNFKLVEVLPSKDSIEKVYVTFVVSSKTEISGEDLSNKISTRISLYNGIYDYNATNEGFKIQLISREAALEYDEEKSKCDSGNVSSSLCLPALLLVIFLVS